MKKEKELFLKKKKVKSRKENLGIDHLLKADEHPKRLVFGCTQILLKAKSFALRHHNPSCCLFGRVQYYVRVGLFQSHHFLHHQPRHTINQDTKCTKLQPTNKKRKKNENMSGESGVD